MGTTGRNVILVTGGSGFLGQHIIRELQDEDFDEIRVFDQTPFENRLDYSPKLPIRSYVGDIRNMQDLQAALVEVTSVIHCAARVDFRMFPDMKTMEDVNVEGTRNVIASCVAASVSHLVLTSTVDVVVGYGEIIDGNESLPYPEHLLFQGYATTKQRAEELTLAANGRPLAKGDGSTLHSLVLRSPVMYGEGDPYFVTTILRGVESRRGVLYRVGTGRALFQAAYAGNVARAHTCAIRALRSCPVAVDGQAYFIIDETPIMNCFDLMEPFMKIRSFRLSSFRVPFWLLYGLFFALEWMLWLLKPIHQFNISSSLTGVIYTNQSLYFSCKLAKEKLNYKPKYDYRQSLERSLPFYKNLQL